ncbi:hypothetical protein L6164_026113 [Bauhinia variegata]|uniref:Uncharacterized protein n=1 Tax=Bauhinia variegata TaxID=167791 RepID=A0ACB9LNL7_BAUVA|nr:hypothetical protein L6164_026113 [Bauhinia variegata]
MEYSYILALPSPGTVKQDAVQEDKREIELGKVNPKRKRKMACVEARNASPYSQKGVNVEREACEWDIKSIAAPEKAKEGAETVDVSSYFENGIEKKARRVISDLFNLCPDAKACTQVAAEDIEKIIKSLGLQRKRARMLQRFSGEYLDENWTYVTQLHGVGKYVRLHSFLIISAFFFPPQVYQYVCL